MCSGKLERWAVLAACCYGMLTVGYVNAGHIFWFLQIENDLGLSAASSGLLRSSMFWGMIVAILIAGPLADRFGFRRMLIGSAVCQSMGVLTVAQASTHWAVLAGILLGSLGTGTVVTLAMPISFQLYPQSRTRICNVIASFCAVGAFAVILLGMALGGHDWTWRGAYLLAAIITLPYGAAFCFLPLPAATGGADNGPGTVQLMRSGRFLLLMVAIFLATFVLVGTTGWLPQYIKEVGGSFKVIGVGMLLTTVSSGVGNWLNAALVRRWGAGRLVAAGSLLSAVSLLMIARSTEPSVAILWFSLLVIGLVGVGPVILAHAGNCYPDAGATMYSLLNAIANFGCAMGMFAVGAAEPYLGLSKTMAVFAIGPLLAAVLVLKLLGRARPGLHRPPQPLPSVAVR